MSNMTYGRKTSFERLDFGRCGGYDGPILDIGGESDGDGV